MSEDLRNPEFWIVLAVGLVSLGFFIRWLYTGGRKRAK
jgi:1,4-dihydroxy-2-naphthoate octaprenyltransferase